MLQTACFVSSEIALNSRPSFRTCCASLHQFDTGSDNYRLASCDRNVVYMMHGREMRAGAGCPCPSRCGGGGGEITANACRKKSCLWLTKWNNHAQCRRFTRSSFVQLWLDGIRIQNLLILVSTGHSFIKDGNTSNAGIRQCEYLMEPNMSNLVCD